jgi:alpha-D-ribose 1-methylphosphonate 5-triphosphate synthase subunit PhnL
MTTEEERAVHRRLLEMLARSDAGSIKAFAEELLPVLGAIASLDAGARNALIRRLDALKTQGVAMIGVFHHPEDVTELIDIELTLTVKEVADVAE